MWAHSWTKDEIQIFFFHKNTKSGYDLQNIFMFKNALIITSQGVLNMGVSINPQQHTFQKLWKQIAKRKKKSCFFLLKFVPFFFFFSRYFIFFQTINKVYYITIPSANLLLFSNLFICYCNHLLFTIWLFLT